MASNALLKHDADELSGLLAESREEIRTLREEAEGGRSDGAVLERFDPRHNRTSSTPAARHGRGDSWTRYHMRKTSLTPSFASSGLGMGPIGDEEERVQTSPSSRSIGYQLNGIPKMPRRSYSERPKTARAFSVRIRPVLADNRVLPLPSGPVRSPLMSQRHLRQIIPISLCHRRSTSETLEQQATAVVFHLDSLKGQAPPKPNESIAARYYF